MCIAKNNHSTHPWKSGFEPIVSLRVHLRPVVAPVGALGRCRPELQQLCTPPPSSLVWCMAALSEGTSTWMQAALERSTTALSSQLSGVMWPRL